MQKLCSCCARSLDLTAFNKRKDGKDGLNGRCRDCMRARMAKWRAEHPEETKAHALKTYRKLCAEKPERLKEYRRRAWDLIRSRRIAEQKKWESENAERIAVERAQRNELRSLMQKIRNDRRSASISDSYVAVALRIPLAALPPDVIRAKRVQLQIVRLLKENRR